MKSLDEIKSILKKFPEAHGVGFVIEAPLAKIARDVGLPGYGDFLEMWKGGNVIQRETVYGEGDEVPDVVGSYFSYNGPALYRNGARLIMGIERTINSIEDILALSEKPKKK